MEGLVEEIISADIGPYTSPGLLLTAAAGIVVLLTGLGARIIELGQAARWTHRGRNPGSFSPDAAADRSPHSRQRIAANMNRRSRTLYRGPSDKMIGVVGGGMPDYSSGSCSRRFQRPETTDALPQRCASTRRVEPLRHPAYSVSDNPGVARRPATSSSTSASFRFASE